VNSSLAENRGGHPMGTQQLGDKQTVHGVVKYQQS
jgi:hypothetical protein